jgi:hypothetical protein
MARPRACVVRLIVAFLLDTNIVSETRRPRPYGGVMAWLRSVPDEEIFVPAVVIGELQAGVETLRRNDPARAQAIELWIDGLATRLSVVPADAAVFRAWARLMLHRSRTLEADGLVAATALVHGFTVVTRNTADFMEFGVAIFNPFGPRG